MLTPIEASRSRVLIIEPTSSIRQMLTDIIRELGFESPFHASKGQEALHILEVEQIDWIICPTLLRDDINALQILNLIINENSLHHVRMSLLVEADSERDFLSLAFEYGLMSFHPKAYVREQIISEFVQLLNKVKQHRGNSTRVATDYLRIFLKEQRLIKNRLILEQNLLDLNPGSERSLLALAEAHIENHEQDKAECCLCQAELINPKVKPIADSLRKKYQLETHQASKLKAMNCLGIKSMVIVDPDTDVLHNMSELGSKIGIQQITCFEDGEEAWTHMKDDGEPGIIVMEWRLPTLSGPFLVQRIRQHGYINVPIVIISSLVTETDTPIMREMGVDQVMQKPFEANDLIKTLVWAIQQNRKPSEQKSFETKIDRLLKANRIAEAEQIITRYLSDERISQAAKLAIQAEYHFAKNRLEDSRKLCSHSLKLESDSLRMLNLMGKLLLIQGSPREALLCFERAQQISPFNLERLMQIAEINFRNNNFQAFQVNLNKAVDLDPNHPDVQRGKCKQAIESGDIEEAKSLLLEIDSVNHIVRDMNNRAVALAQNGQFDHGILIYQQTLQALPVRWKEIRSAVQYNLALAYAKYGDTDKCLETIDAISGNIDGVILARKIQSLKQKASMMRASGKAFSSTATSMNQNQAPLAEVNLQDSLELQGEPTLEETAANITSAKLQTGDWLQELRQSITVQRGEICCYMIYLDIEGFSESARPLVNGLPRFKRRGAIGKAV